MLTIRAPGVAARPSKPALAILPFQNLSSDRGQEYFCRGVTEELAAALNSMQIFRVVPAGMVSTDLQQLRSRNDIHAVVDGWSVARTIGCGWRCG